MVLTMNRSLSRFQAASLSLRRVVIVGLPEKEPRKEVALVSFVRKKILLSSVFCKKCMFFTKYFLRKSADIRRHCKMLATTCFPDTPIVTFRPCLTSSAAAS